MKMELPWLALLDLNRTWQYPLMLLEKPKKIKTNNKITQTLQKLTEKF